jgi:hypothetical protein
MGSTLRRAIAALGALAPLCAARASAQELFELRRVTPRVYFAYARPEFFPISANCNTVVVLLDDGVLVVDSHSRPSAARSLIAQLRTLTSKPVRYVVDTHVHSDQYQGNAAYLSAWPSSAEIISSELTREAIEHIGIPRIRHDDRYLAELQAMHVVLPDVTFDRSLVIRRGATTDPAVGGAARLRRGAGRARRGAPRQGGLRPLGGLCPGPDEGDRRGLRRGRHPGGSAGPGDAGAARAVRLALSRRPARAVGWRQHRQSLAGSERRDRVSG